MTRRSMPKLPGPFLPRSREQKYGVCVLGRTGDRLRFLTIWSRTIGPDSLTSQPPLAPTSTVDVGSTHAVQNRPGDYRPPTSHPPMSSVTVVAKDHSSDLSTRSDAHPRVTEGSGPATVPIGLPNWDGSYSTSAVSQDCHSLAQTDKVVKCELFTRSTIRHRERPRNRRCNRSG